MNQIKWLCLGLLHAVYTHIHFFFIRSLRIYVCHVYHVSKLLPKVEPWTEPTKIPALMKASFEWGLVDRELGSLLCSEGEAKCHGHILLRKIKETQAGLIPEKWRSWLCFRYASWTGLPCPSITILESSILPALMAQIISRFKHGLPLLILFIESFLWEYLLWTHSV